MENLNSQDRKVIEIALNEAIRQTALDLRKMEQYKELPRDKVLEEQLKKDIKAYEQAREKMRNFI